MEKYIPFNIVQFGTFSVGRGLICYIIILVLFLNGATANAQFNCRCHKHPKDLTIDFVPISKLLDPITDMYFCVTFPDGKCFSSKVISNEIVMEGHNQEPGTNWKVNFLHSGSKYTFFVSSNGKKVVANSGGAYPKGTKVDISLSRAAINFDNKEEEVIFVDGNVSLDDYIKEGFPYRENLQATIKKGKDIFKPIMDEQVNLVKKLEVFETKEPQAHKTFISGTAKAIGTGLITGKVISLHGYIITLYIDGLTAMFNANEAGKVTQKREKAFELIFEGMADVLFDEINSKEFSGMERIYYQVGLEAIGRLSLEDRFSVAIYLVDFYKRNPPCPDMRYCLDPLPISTPEEYVEVISWGSAWHAFTRMYYNMDNLTDD